MAITLKGISTLAKITLPIILIADFVGGSSYVGPPVPIAGQFGLSYITAVMMLIAFHKRSPIEIAFGTAILLVLMWALNTIGDDISRVIAAMAGIICGLLPAYLRDLQKLANNEEYMDFTQLSRLRRRRTDVADSVLHPRQRERTTIHEAVAVISESRLRRDDGERLSD